VPVPRSVHSSASTRANGPSHVFPFTPYPARSVANCRKVSQRAFLGLSPLSALRIQKVSPVASVATFLPAARKCRPVSPACRPAHFSTQTLGQPREFGKCRLSPLSPFFVAALAARAMHSINRLVPLTCPADLSTEARRATVEALRSFSEAGAKAEAKPNTTYLLCEPPR
jgi:hypothetical protein